MFDNKGKVKYIVRLDLILSQRLSRANLVMVERRSISPEKPLPLDDPMDAEELVDPTFRHDHKVPGQFWICYNSAY